MNTPLVSVIIPIKDMSDLSRPIFDDLKNQTYPNIEVITDDSYGVSHARNIALEKAKGKYVCFFDCDDRIDDEIISYLTDEIDGVAGAACGYDISRLVVKVPKKASEDEREVFYSTPETVSRVLSGADMMCRVFFEENYEGYLWNKIFRLDIIKRHHIRFNESLWYKEDCAFVIDYLKYARLFRMSPVHLYHYIENEGSLMMTAGVQEEMHLNEKGIFDDEEPEEIQNKKNELDASEESKENAEAFEEQLPAPSKKDLELFEKRLTEIKAYSYMRKTLFKKPYSDARFFCGMNMADRELTFFFEILTKDEKRQFDYKDSSLRKFARRIRFLPFQPGDEDTLRLYQAFIDYGRTGSSLDTGIFEED